MASKKEPVVDLRSDTLTHPTQAMRDAMARAPVGDDVFGEDPTVAELERVSAERVGHEAALFVPTGTMANQVALWVHSGRQGAMICEEGAHVFAYEGGAPALLSNLLVKTVRGTRGVFGPADLEPLFSPHNVHFAPVKIVELENTHNRAGGTCWTSSQTRAVARLAHERNARVHLDGARLFNAAVAQGVRPAALAEGTDSVAFCFSKGLSAPVGSVVCGSKDFVREARRVRKVLGGGMRQAGILAAAGLVALDTMVDRLREDHANARRLAEGLSKIPGIHVDLDAVQTNIVIFDVAGTGLDGAAFCAALEAQGVRCLPRDVGSHVRMVTHRHVEAAAVRRVLEAVDAVVSPRMTTRRR